LRLAARPGASRLPKVELVDLKQAPPGKGRWLSPQLEHALVQTLADGEQALLFLNRRGYAPVLACSDCGWKSECPHCSAYRVFHKSDRTLRCHHCGLSQRVPRACPGCGNLDIAALGRGTEQLEERVAELLRSERNAQGEAVRIARIDADSARSREALAQQLAQVHAGEVDVLVGTQMVAKGQDFERVTLVGVLNADQGLKSPDFRSQERTFQLLTQVSGRSGRRHVRGEVLIQTRQVRHPLFALVQQHNYTEFARNELESRRAHGYPPRVRLIRISVRHREEAAAAQSALWLAGELRRLLGARVVGPSVPSIARLRNEYYRELLLKIERGGPGLDAVKRLVLSAVAALQGSPTGQQCRIWLDVDPA